MLTCGGCRFVDEHGEEDIGRASNAELRVSALRFMEGSHEPVSHTQILVHPSYEAIRERLTEPGATVYRLIEGLHGERIAELKQEISCISMPKDVGLLMQARARSPALRVLRYYMGSHDHLFSVAVNTYPEGRFKLTTRWRLDWAADKA